MIAPVPEEPDDDSVLEFVQAVEVGRAEAVMLCAALVKVTATSPDAHYQGATSGAIAT